MNLWTQVPTLKDVISKVKEFEGIIFDMDGTIFNSEPVHASALREALVQLNPNFDFPSSKDLDDLYRGTCDSFVFEDSIKRNWLSDSSAYEKFLSLKNEKLISIDTCTEEFCSPKILNFITEIVQSNYKIGLVTNSEKIVTHEHLKQHGIFDSFEIIITREDTETPKPHAAPYLKGCKDLGISPAKTIVFEDSNAGIESATSAGTQVQKVTWYE
ncbi:MAG: HAD family phosphatase [Bacteriovoracaceae bacterium]|nr:HAD family phosphatase [Bacteriovoracaceae bacterium]